MAKFRTNHSRQSSAASGGTMVKVGLFAAILAGLFWAFNQFSGKETSFEEAIEQADDFFKGDAEGPAGPSKPTVADDFLPSSTTGQIIKHEFYALSYSEAHEQAEWVAYELTKESLRIPNVPRSGNFRPDPNVRKASASDRDYSGSGYDRGHMAPAGDMAFSKEAMSESFYMSNMSPQIRNFNGGAWRELEENVRDWAYKFGRVYVVTGPVLTRGIRDKIGGNEVSVPDEYYKVILDIDEPEVKAIAFLMPNEISTLPLIDYALSIDEVEEITGIDFFENFLEENTEAHLEANYDVSKWPTKSKRYEDRLQKWNKRK